MPAHVLLTDLAALLCALAGFHMAFRQRLVRRWWRSAREARGGARPERAVKEEGEDPVHYALIIFGMMLFAFGLVIGAFTTVYWLMTKGAG
jgi:drug/metabolite transporter (DMT)-like permease